MKPNLLTRIWPAGQWMDREATYCLRGVCILIIVMGHASSSATDPLMQTAAWQTFTDATRYWEWGTWGTGVFFLLSGYGMTLSLDRLGRTTWTYAGRKLWKLLEAYLLLWVVYMACIVLLRRDLLTPSLLTDLLSLGMPQGVDAWFFKVILAAYVLMLLLWAVPMNTRWRVVTMGVLAVAYYAVMRQAGAGPWWFNTILCQPLGMWMALRRDWLSRRPWWTLAAAAVCLAGSLLTSAALFPPLTASLVAVLAVWLLPLHNRLLHFVGTGSLYFYLLEEPAYHCLVRPLSDSLPLYVVATWAACALLTWGWLGVKAKKRG